MSAPPETPLGATGTAGLAGALRGRVAAWIHAMAAGGPARRTARPVRGEIVGVDLGGSSIKLARVRRTASGAELVDHADVPLHTSENDPAQRQAAALAALRRLVRDKHLSGKSAVGLIYGLDVVLRRTTMPDLAPADLLSALALEAHKFIAFPTEHLVLDYERVGTAGPGESDLLVAACDRRRLVEIRTLIERSGLKPRAVTVPPLAFRSLMRQARLASPQEVVALFDVGHHTTNLCIFRHDELRFSRELSLGSHAFTEALRTIIVPGQGALKLSAEEAERLKHEHGIPMGEDEKKLVGGVLLAHVAVMLRPTLERLVREIWSSFDYCNEEFFGEPVQRVYLTGRGARLRNLAPYLESVLKVPVSPLEPGRDAMTSRRPLADEEAGSLGFAPALALEDFNGINLLRGLEQPPSTALESLASRVTLPRVAAAAALALLVDGGLTELGRMDARSRVDAMQRARARMSAEAPALADLESRMVAQRAHETLRASLTGGGTDWPLLLKDLSLRVSPGVALRELRPEEIKPDPSTPPGTSPQRRLVLEASVGAQVARPNMEVAATLQALMRSPFLSDVRLVESAPADEGTTHLVISCALRGTTP